MRCIRSGADSVIGTARNNLDVAGNVVFVARMDQQLDVFVGLGLGHARS